MGNVSKMLVFAAGLFIALVFIGMGVNAIGPSSDASKTAHTDFAETTTELKDQKYLTYDNTVISGSQVVNALRKFQDEAEAQSIALYVETGKSKGAGTWYFSQFAADAVTSSSTKNLAGTKEITSSTYVNPSGMFNSSVERDSNGVIRVIKFMQK